jgi:hypothetical protein
MHLNETRQQQITRKIDTTSAPVRRIVNFTDNPVGNNNSTPKDFISGHHQAICIDRIH